MRKQKRLFSLVAIVCILAMSLSLVACGHTPDPDPSDEHKHTFSKDWSSDAAYHWHAATCEHTTVVDSRAAHSDDNGDKKCDVCGYVMGTVEPGPGPGPGPSGEHEHTYSDVWTTDYENHWHAATCEHTGEVKDVAEHADDNGDKKCDVCDFEMFEKVVYTFVAEQHDAKVYADGSQWGNFGVTATTEIRNRPKTYTDAEGNSISFARSVKLGGGAQMLTVNAPAAGVLELIVQNGSSGANMQNILITDPDGNVTDIEYVGNAEGSPLVKLTYTVLKAGEYTVVRKTGTTDVYWAQLTVEVRKSELAGIQVSNTGLVDYVEGQDLDASGIVVEEVYENGRTELLDAADYAIDDSQVDMSTAGVYKVKVSYEKAGQTYTTEYEINVYAIQSITLGKNAIRVPDKKDPAYSPFNGAYANTALRQIYMVGQEVSFDGLSVIAHAQLNGASRDFIFTSMDDYARIFADDITATAGKKTITIDRDGHTESFDIWVLAPITGIESQQNVDCYVSKDVENVGALVDGRYQFATINQAIEFLTYAGVSADADKRIDLAAGTYNEKVEVTIPHLVIAGESAETTIIEWNSLYGQLDESGFTHVTDSTQTLAVRYQAEGFILKGVTVSNYWNSQARFDEAGLKKERGLALLVQADKVLIHDSILLGYQDTVEFFTGRQMVENSLIAGATDFIFGSDNTTYFYNCEIRSILTADDVKENPQGGYITAFKGENKAGVVAYGAIFDNCRFTADAGVAAGKTAIGRTWGANATVAVINSELGAHISLAASTGAGRDERYVKMNGDPEAAHFVEYNNTGAGAIAASQNGVTVLEDQTVAANYSDFAVIFATVNGEVKYDTEWAGLNERYTVSIYNGQEIVAELLAYEGTTVTAEQLAEICPTIDGYTMEGIFADEALATAFEGKVVDSAFGVFAKYEKVQAGQAIVSTYTFESSALDAFAAGAKADGETEVVGTDGAFTIHWSAKAKVDSSSKTWTDGYTSAQRVNFGGKTVIGDVITNCIEFNVKGSAVVKVWYVSNTDTADRPITIFDATGAIVTEFTEIVAKNATGYCELTIETAGMYYLGLSVNSNYFFKVEVVDTVVAE